jgi:hypothetical protein
LFKGVSKLLNCGGINTDTCEVINLASSASTCKNPPNLPATVYAAIGGLGFKTFFDQTTKKIINRNLTTQFIYFLR